MSDIPLTRVRVLESAEAWWIKEPRTHSHNGMTRHHEESIPKDGRWKFNGDVENPTFSPSLNCSTEAAEDIPASRNHIIILGGDVTYCRDCTHDLATKTLPLAFFNEAEVSSNWRWIPGHVKSD